jgi:hypothetical protein
VPLGEIVGDPDRVTDGVTDLLGVFVTDGVPDLEGVPVPVNVGEGVSVELCEEPVDGVPV